MSTGPITAVEVLGRRFLLTRKDWETEFFGRTFGSLSWVTSAVGPTGPSWRRAILPIGCPSVWTETMLIKLWPG